MEYATFQKAVSNCLHDVLPYLGRLNVIVLWDVYFNFHNSNVLKVNTKLSFRAVESNHGGWLKWCRANRSGKKEFDYLDWILGRGEGK